MFDKKILPLSDSLYRMARSILQDADEAHDAVQDLLMGLWEKRSELAGVDNLNAIIRMRDVEEIEIQEIADITEITPNVLTADSSANVGNLISDINNATTRQNYEKVVEVREKGERTEIFVAKDKEDLSIIWLQGTPQKK